jgi:hypothetical protein
MRERERTRAGILCATKPNDFAAGLAGLPIRTVMTSRGATLPRRPCSVRVRAKATGPLHAARSCADDACVALPA